MGLNFDIKGKIEEVANRLKDDPALLKEFQKEPVKAVEKLLGIDIPDEQLQPLIDGIKAKLTAEDISNVVDGLKGLFNKN